MYVCLLLLLNPHFIQLGHGHTLVAPTQSQELLCCMASRWRDGQVWHSMVW